MGDLRYYVARVLWRSGWWCWHDLAVWAFMRQPFPSRSGRCNDPLGRCYCGAAARGEGNGHDA